MNLLDPSFLIFTDIFALALFAIVAYFTRANWHRILGAMLACVPLALLVYFVDRLALRMGWWFYPALPNGPTPIAWCIAAALVFGGTMGLVGWRILRRYATPGFIIFALLLSLFGISRDLAWSHFGSVISFGPGFLPYLADYLAYLSAIIIFQLVMLIIVGKPRSDRLARP